jgi:hypothetical protein
MLHVIGVALALLVFPAAASPGEGAYCSQVYEGVVTRLRWALANQKNLDASQIEGSCIIYRGQFYDAAVMRQTASRCEDNRTRQQTLSVLDAEIDAFNELIAAHCDGQ